MAEKRKLAFWEIGYGRLGKELQDELEQAAITACERHAPVKITLTVTVGPPTMDNIGKVAYKLKTTQPARESLDYEAEFDHGLIVATAPDNIGVLQERLKFPEEENVSQFPTEMRPNNGTQG